MSFAGLAASEEVEVEHTAAAAQVQLSVLRAELSASDAELQHVREHLAIVLQQQATSAAGTMGAATGQQQPSSEVDFLREVRQHCLLLLFVEHSCLLISRSGHASHLLRKSARQLMLTVKATSYHGMFPEAARHNAMLCTGAAPCCLLPAPSLVVGMTLAASVIPTDPPWPASKADRVASLHDIPSSRRLEARCIKVSC